MIKHIQSIFTNKSKFLKWYSSGDNLSGMANEKYHRASFIVLPIIALFTAYILGLHPPKNTDIELNETNEEAPIVQTLGYNTNSFSLLEIKSSDGAISQYHPVTAVRQWDNETVYSEKSRQSEEIFSSSSLDGLLLSLQMPFEPNKILINDIDQTPYSIKKGKDYFLNLEMSYIFSGNKNDLSKTLEVLVYFQSDVSDEKVAVSANHIEKADHYLIEVISNGY